MAITDTSGAKFQPGQQNITGAVSLANAALIAAGVVKGIAGKAVADSINGNPLMREQLAATACSRIVKRLNERYEQVRSTRLVK